MCAVSGIGLEILFLRVPKVASGTRLSRQWHGVGNLVPPGTTVTTFDIIIMRWCRQTYTGVFNLNY